MKNGCLILASASPRRRELLAQIGLSAQVSPANIDETPLEGESAAQYVERLALTKSGSVVETLAARASSEGPFYVIGSDTSVVLDGEILGKPDGEADFERTMRRLSGRSHQVMTAFAVIKIDNSSSPIRQQTVSSVVTTDVCFRSLSNLEISRYWQSGEPRDKAGGYGIQGLGSIFVERITGSYSNVVGMPLNELAIVLQDLGYDVWQDNPLVVKE
jgi:septum formation protein